MSRIVNLAAIAFLFCFVVTGAVAQSSARYMLANGMAALERQDYSEAVMWFRLSADQGDPDGQSSLGEMYYFGQGVPQNYTAAAKWYRRAADQGDADSQTSLGDMYFLGQGVPQSHAEAVKWFRLAADQGDAFGQLSLGYMYRNGLGVAQNHAEAVRWYRLSAGQGDANGQSSLGDMYFFGLGVLQNHTEAVKWYRLSADQGGAHGQYSMGYMYDRGLGVSQSHTEAAKWYRLSADQGNADGQNSLGDLYFSGQGVLQNHAEAVKWYRLAADQSNAYGQYSLGHMYHEGLGVSQNYAEAARWYRLSADQGSANAQFSLGLMYEYGNGVPRDYELAYFWFDLAASRIPTSGEESQRIVQSRNRVAAYLAPAELARAQLAVSEWTPGASYPATQMDQAEEDDDFRERIVALQIRLASLGFDPGPANGVLGPRTRAAIRAFQEAEGLAVDGKFSWALEGQVILAASPEASRRELDTVLEVVSTGTGFRVSADGHILTNAHVVEGCTDVRLPGEVVAVVAIDPRADLALLKGAADSSFARFRQGQGVRPGAGIVAVGFPLHGLLASGAKVTTGTVSALAGPDDDRRLMQISAPVQPGNSGGPVFDMGGGVVGVVTAQLDAMEVARETGDIPQNVNFAVNAHTVRAFLDAEGIDYATAPSDQLLQAEDVAAAAREFTVAIECWN